MTTLLATWREPGRVAIHAAWQARAAGADLRSTLEAGLATAELDPNLIAIGLGSLPNADGDLELDAAIMDGRDLTAGAVCSVRGIVPVISVARAVMEDTPHVMLSGEQARRFAVSKGFTARNLMTAENCRRYEEWLANPRLATEDDYVHSAEHGKEHEHRGDTISMIGFDGSNFVAASSTSGLAWKLPGRVGDSPIVGAGIYADDEAGAAAATGFGEELWKACASFRTVRNMASGMSAQQACAETIDQMSRRQPASLTMPCVVLAVDKTGSYGAATTVGEFPLWVCRDGSIDLEIRPAIPVGTPR